MALRPPKFLGQLIIFAAPFESFCRIFGHLAIVLLRHQSALLGDEEPPLEQEVSLVCLKRPLPVEKVVECLEILGKSPSGQSISASSKVPTTYSSC